MNRLISVKEAAEKWGVSERRINKLLNENRIAGAKKNGRYWYIPSNAIKPKDNRINFKGLENDKKTIVIAGINSDIGKELSKILLDENYKIIGLYQKDTDIDEELINVDICLKAVDYFDRENLLKIVNEINEDLYGFVFMEIYFDLEDQFNFDYNKFEDSYRVNVFSMNLLVRELVKKMNFESSIVIVSSIEAYRGSFGASAYASSQAAKVNLVQTFANIFTEMYGIRINSIMSGWIGGVMESDDTFNKAKESIPMKRLGQPSEIADDIYLMLTRHKYTNGSSLVSDGGYLSMDSQSRTEDLDSGKFYRILDKYISETKKGSYIWAISTMMDNEWNDDPLERKFIQSNLDAANRGVKLERIFIFEKSEIEKIKTNKYIKIYLKNKNISSYYVLLNDLTKNNSRLLSIVNDGYIGIDNYALLLDLPSDGTSRGYVTLNKKEIEKAKECFLSLKQISKPLSDLMKH